MYCQDHASGFRNFFIKVQFGVSPIHNDFRSFFSKMQNLCSLWHYDKIFNSASKNDLSFFFNLHFTCYHSFKIIFLLNNFPKIKFFNYFITSYNDHMNFALKVCLICLSTLCAYNVSIKQVQRMITLISYCGEWKYID